MIANRLDQSHHYFSEEPWQVAFRFLQSLSPDTPEGRTDLQGDDIFANVMCYQTRATQDAVLETHRNYIDIHVTLDGAERIDWFPREALQIKTPYDNTKDAEFYHRPGKAPIQIANHPGAFLVLFPEDAHMPQLTLGKTPTNVKKVVLKLKTSLVR